MLAGVDLTALTLDQLRLLVRVSEEGSFSGAARRLRRAQSAVSYGIGNLERNVGVALFDRTGRKPTLTPLGQRLVEDARHILDLVSAFGAKAESLVGEIDLELRIAVSAVCPISLVTAFGKAFQAKYPSVALQLQTAVMQDVGTLVLDKHCDVGISGPFHEESSELSRRFLMQVEMVPVAAPQHALCKEVNAHALSDAVRIVIAQGTSQSTGGDRRWCVTDEQSKLAFIVAGLGWGYVPRTTVRTELADRALVELAFERPAPRVELSVVSRVDTPPGPAGQWLMHAILSLARPQRFD